jgi:hypothetical protein
MTWYNVVDHKFGCPACEGTQTESEIRLVRNEIRTRSVDDSVTEESAEKITSESEYCESCGEGFDQARWEFGRCQACGGAGYDCEDVSHCMHCDLVEDDCECERAECCGNFIEDCECKESDVKEKDNVIEKAVRAIEGVDYGRLEMRVLATTIGNLVAPDPPDAPTPDKNRVQTPAATWTLPEDLPEE